MDIKKTFGKKLKDSKKLLSGIYKNLNKINDNQKN